MKFTMKQSINSLLGQQLDEHTPNKNKKAFLISGIIHLLFLFIIVFGPGIFPLSQRSEPIEVTPPKRLGFLALPKDYQQIRQRHIPPIITEKNSTTKKRRSEINSKRLAAPSSNQNMKQVNKSNVPNQIVQPLRPSPTSEISKTTLDADLKNQVSRKNSNSKKIVKMKKNPVNLDLKELFAGLGLPGNLTSSSLEKVKKGNSFGASHSGNDDIRSDFNKRQPNFSVKHPTIISETHGVNFNPWLSSIYFRVRNNWYSVIPQVYRTGMRGVVVIVFDVRNNGVLEELEVVKSSGRSPYDRAAISSLKLSEPFPSFPPDFVGDHLTLQFTYFYNIAS